MLEDSWDNISEVEDANSSPLFKLGRSPVSVVDVTPIFVEDPPEVVFGSFADDAEVVIDELVGGVVVDGAVDSVLVEEVASVLPLTLPVAVVAGFEAAVEEAEEDIEAVVEDDEGADVVADEVLVELGVLVVATGGDEFVFEGVTTYDVPNPNRCPQYLLSSISSSKNISFIRKNVCPVSRASDPA